MAQCKITVLRCCFDAALKARYVPDPNYGPCPYFQPGQVFFSTGDRPDGFDCNIGWKSIQDEVQGMCSDAPFFKEQVVCCNDGIRPVLFLLEHLDDPAEI